LTILEEVTMYSIGFRNRTTSLLEQTDSENKEEYIRSYQN